MRLLGRVLVPGAVLVVETAAGTPAGLPWTVVREKRYGDTRVTFLVADADDAAARRRSSRLMPSNVTAICPGTFDPVTVGHLDIITRGATKFGRVIVGPHRGAAAQVAAVHAGRARGVPQEALAGHDNIVVDRFNELVVEFARRWDAHVILKGLRAISDFEYEFAMAQLNRKLAPDIETVFMMASPEHSFLSSSGVREIAAFGGSVADLVPPAVARRLRGGLSARRQGIGYPRRVAEYGRPRSHRQAG